ncbi:MAG: hypothetical protein J5476_12860 [Lachnospiraceae bacterium]|nr:hypothetical protein [Lachnospiraceae bacterium]
MKQIIIGQILLIICCGFYLVWWYLGYKPNVTVDRFGGINGALLSATTFFGMAGIICSLMPVEETSNKSYSQLFVVLGGIVGYILLMLLTKLVFQRIVTTELFLIVGWTMLEMSIINRLSGSGLLVGPKLVFMYIVLALAFIISMVLYVAYYRMDEMKAFYAAMVPLVTEALAMGTLVLLLI